MYEAFYGLREKPFNLTPDPRFLFLSEKHKEAFAHLLYGIKNRGGFVMVSGEIGTGKTTICRTLLNNLEDDTEVAFIFNPCLSPEELLRTINQDFGIPTRAVTIKGLIDELNAFLLDRRAKDKNCVLVIDEAQDLSPPVLEQIRLLSNLETETEKLLQIVLIGQPELAQMLELQELRQLNQRITARYHLRELSFHETLQYIAYRLRVAGGRRKVRFTRAAVRKVYRHSKGVPRMINAICDRALLVGYTLESRDINTSIIRRAAREVIGEKLKRRKRRTWLRAALKPAAVAAAVALALAGAYWLAPTEQWLKDWWPARGANPARTASLTPPNAPAPVPAVQSTSPAPVAPAASGSAIDYDTLLDGLDPVAARDAGADAILQRWGVADRTNLPRGQAIEDLLQFAGRNGLDAQLLSPSLDQLMAIDLPAFVTVLRKDLVPMWLGLVGRRGEELQVAVGPDRLEYVPRDVLDKRYTVQAVVLWRDPLPSAPVLTENAAGDAVLALQEQLNGLGRLSGPPTGVFDSATAAAIRRLQSELNLSIDGKVGRQTRMVLCSWSPQLEMARLSAPAPEEIAPVVEPGPAPAILAETPPAPAGPMPVAAAAVTTPNAPAPAAMDLPPTDAAPVAETAGAAPLETPAPPVEPAEFVEPLTPFGTGLSYLAGFGPGPQTETQAPPTEGSEASEISAQSTTAGGEAE